MDGSTTLEIEETIVVEVESGMISPKRWRARMEGIALQVPKN